MNEHMISNGFLERLSDQLRTGTNTQTVFGEPVERNGATVIPVARARWGVGGGGFQPGESAAKGEAGGTGGGGGAMVSPVGYIELTDRRVRFRPIRNASFAPVLAIAAGAAALSVVALLRSRRSPWRAFA